MTPEIKAFYEERKKKFLGLEVATMEKVLLTPQQADQVESIITERSTWTELTDLSREELGAALSGNYELIPEPPKFLPGHYVLRKDGHPIDWKKRIGVIDRKVKFSYETVSVNGGEFTRHIHRSKLRHATPEEYYWLEELGREKVGGFLEGDVILALGSTYRYGVNGDFDYIGEETANKWREEGKINGIYPTQSYKPFPKEAN